MTPLQTILSRREGRDDQENHGAVVSDEFGVVASTFRPISKERRNDAE